MIQISHVYSNSHVLQTQNCIIVDIYPLSSYNVSSNTLQLSLEVIQFMSISCLLVISVNMKYGIKLYGVAKPLPKWDICNVIIYFISELKTTKEIYILC